VEQQAGVRQGLDRGEEGERQGRRIGRGTSGPCWRPRWRAGRRPCIGPSTGGSRLPAYSWGGRTRCRQRTKAKGPERTRRPSNPSASCARSSRRTSIGTVRAETGIRRSAPRRYSAAEDKDEERDEYMQFVMDERGSTKTIHRRHWCDFVRLVATDVEELF